jgi:hypothetical protein
MRFEYTARREGTIISVTLDFVRPAKHTRDYQGTMWFEDDEYKLWKLSMAWGSMHVLVDLDGRHYADRMPQQSRGMAAV